MAYRNKTYVCFDADNDFKYYSLMRAWKQNDNTNFNFYDAHELNSSSDDSKEESIKKQLRERLKNSKYLVVLLGEHTKNLTKFVKWEMEEAKSMHMPIIVVNLNQKREIDYERFPKVLNDYPTINIEFKAKILQYALENWGDAFLHHVMKDEYHSFYYGDDVYKKLGL